MKLILTFIASLTIFTILQAEPLTLLPRQTEYTRPFFEDYPEYNGSGVTIFIMDTGIEVTLPGLDKNPDGTQKVIDVYDASKTGDVPVTRAIPQDIDHTKYLTNGEDIYLKDYSVIPGNPEEFYVGLFSEDQFKNSHPHDINNNGSTADEWGFVIYQDENFGWNLIMDLDQDHSLRNEKVIQDYNKNYDLIKFQRSHPVYGHEWFSMAINIYPSKKVVSFHFDDGGHGTHVAGIAAGYQINGDPETSGMAPGAHLVSIKIGAGSMPGSATTTGAKKRGLQFIEDYMKRHPGHAVINMSFGIESANEGFSDIEKTVNTFCIDNPNVTFCTSAGNNGPGISTIGTPAGAQFVIASGALMDPATGRDKYGYDLTQPALIHFSSRGGDTNKPDVVSPGAMLSTVTRWDQGNFKWGTSMASPYTSGIIACILSGLQEEYPGTKVSSAFLKSGLQQTSSLLPGYPRVEQGSGIIDMMKLFKWTKKNIKKSNSVMYQLSTETYDPGKPDKKSNAVYWRISDVNDIPENNVVTLIPNFSSSTPQFLRDEYYQKYKVRSSVDWAEPKQRNISIYRENKTNILIGLETSQIPENSLQTGTIYLIPDGPGESIRQQFYVSVINPLHFDEANEFRYVQKNVSIRPGEAKHYFVSVPYGATAMHVQVRSGEKAYSMVRTYIYDNYGMNINRLANLNSEDGMDESETIISSHLTSAVWEIVTYGDLGGKNESRYDIEIYFSGIEFDKEDPKIISFTKDSRPVLNGVLYPQLDSYKNVEIKGSIDGYIQKHNLELGKSDTVSISFYKLSGDKSVRFEFRIPPERFSYFTDLATMIQNDSGHSMVSKGMGFTHDQIILPEGSPEGHYELMLIYAYTDGDSKTVFKLPIDEIHLVKKKIIKTQEIPDNSIYQGIPFNFEIVFEDLPSLLPYEYDYTGELQIVQKGKRIISNKRITMKLKE